MNRNRYVFQSAQDDTASGSGGGGTAGSGGIGGPANAGASADANKAGDAGAGQGASKEGEQGAASLLQTGVAGAAATEGEWKGAPEKYQVKKADGTIDEAATLRKVDEARAALEKRMGSTGLPPASPAEYTPEGMPEGFTMDELKGDERYQAFAKDAHAAGLTNAQMGLVLRAWNERAAELAGASASLTVEQAKAELGKVWADDATMTKGLGDASSAIAAIAAKAGIDIAAINAAGLGVNPIFLRLMAPLAAEFKADGPTPVDASSVRAWEDEVATLRAHAAYRDPNHVEHEKIIRRYRELYQQRYPDKK